MTPVQRCNCICPNGWLVRLHACIQGVLDHAFIVYIIIILSSYLHYKAGVHRGFSVFGGEICSQHGGVVILRVIVKLWGKKIQYCFIKVFQILRLSTYFLELCTMYLVTNSERWANRRHVQSLQSLHHTLITCLERKTLSFIMTKQEKNIQIKLFAIIIMGLFLYSQLENICLVSLNEPLPPLIISNMLMFLSKRSLEKSLWKIFK